MPHSKIEQLRTIFSLKDRILSLLSISLKTLSYPLVAAAVTTSSVIWTSPRRSRSSLITSSSLCTLSKTIMPQSTIRSRAWQESMPAPMLPVTDGMPTMAYGAFRASLNLVTYLHLGNLDTHRASRRILASGIRVVGLFRRWFSRPEKLCSNINWRCGSATKLYGRSLVSRSTLLRLVCMISSLYSTKASAHGGPAFIFRNCQTLISTFASSKTTP